MPLFISDEEYERCAQDAVVVAAKADEFIRDLYNQLENVKAQADAASITAEQTCSVLEQKYVSLSSEHSSLQLQYTQLNSSFEQRLSELSKVQAEKQQAYLQSVSLFLIPNSLCLLFLLLGVCDVLDAFMHNEVILPCV